MVAGNVSVGIAFLGGLLSFLSPCVFPLIPAYVSYMSSRAAMQVLLETGFVAARTQTVTMSQSPNRIGLLLHGVMFVMGQMLVFVVFGITVNVGLRAISSTSYQFERGIAHIGGLLVIFFGLYVLCVIGSVFKILLT